jgi:hypothetical protein
VTCDENIGRLEQAANPGSAHKKQVQEVKTARQQEERSLDGVRVKHWRVEEVGP